MKKTFISAKFFSMLLGGTISSLFSVALAMTDTIVAGRMLGEAALAAVNLVIPTYSLSVFFAMVLSIGAPILNSAPFRNRKRTGRSARRLLRRLPPASCSFWGWSFSGMPICVSLIPGKRSCRMRKNIFSG